MNWIIFAISTYVLLALHVGLRHVMAVDTPWGDIEPQFVLLLAVFVGLHARSHVAMVAWAVLGLLLDLTQTWPLAEGQRLTFIGPYTLGYLVGGYVLLQVRAMLFRQHPLTIGSMMVICGIGVHLIVVANFAVRDWYEPLVGWSAGEQLVRRMLSLLYSAAIGVVLAAPLVKATPLFGFQISKVNARRR